MESVAGAKNRWVQVVLVLFLQRFAINVDDLVADFEFLPRQTDCPFDVEHFRILWILEDDDIAPTDFTRRNDWEPGTKSGSDGKLVDNQTVSYQDGRYHRGGRNRHWCPYVGGNK